MFCSAMLASILLLHVALHCFTLLCSVALCTSTAAVPHIVSKSSGGG